MRVEKILIADIKVANRRREDFGDVEGLAASINRFGLLHPITVDGDNNLVAGERRLRACRDVLKLDEIDARLYSELTEDERREIELEENVRRKDLTPLEISKNLVALAETAAKVVENEFPLSVSEKSEGKRGRPQKKVSKDKVAERIGVNRQTITNASQHVAAVERYPELAMVAPTQKDAITVAKNLDALKDSDRSEARSRLMKHDQNTLAALAEKPPIPPRKPTPDKSPGVKWRDWLNDTRLRLSGMLRAGPEQLTRQWNNREWDSFLADLRGFRTDLDQLISDMEEQEDELRQQAG
jgi:ParB-like chromosome segregation protein Spo0J